MQAQTVLPYGNTGQQDVNYLEIHPKYCSGIVLLQNH